MPTYRRRKDNDTWHWCTNCSNWPTADYEEKYFPGRPTDGRELDNECKSKEANGICTKC